MTFIAELFVVDWKWMFFKKGMFKYSKYSLVLEYYIAKEWIREIPDDSEWFHNALLSKARYKKDMHIA